MYQGVVNTSLRLRSRICNNSLGERLLGTSHVRNNLLCNTDAFGFMKASQSIHQFPAEVMPLQKYSGGLNWCPSTTEKISISLRPGLGLRSSIVERKKAKFYLVNPSNPANTEKLTGVLCQNKR